MEAKKLVKRPRCSKDLIFHMIEFVGWIHYGSTGCGLRFYRKLSGGNA
jgi:hypothetical protein